MHAEGFAGEEWDLSRETYVAKMNEAPISHTWIHMELGKGVREPKSSHILSVTDRLICSQSC